MRRPQRPDLAAFALACALIIVTGILALVIAVAKIDVSLPRPSTMPAQAELATWPS